MGFYRDESWDLFSLQPRPQWVGALGMQFSDRFCGFSEGWGLVFGVRPIAPNLYWAALASLMIGAIGLL
jgi:hypothetical protein